MGHYALILSVGPLTGHYAVVVFGHTSGDDVAGYWGHNGDMGSDNRSQIAASEKSSDNAVVAATPDKRSGALRSANVRARVFAGP